MLDSFPIGIFNIATFIIAMTAIVWMFRISKRGTRYESEVRKVAKGLLLQTERFDEVISALAHDSDSIKNFALSVKTIQEDVQAHIASLNELSGEESDEKDDEK